VTGKATIQNQDDWGEVENMLGSGHARKWPYIGARCRLHRLTRYLNHLSRTIWSKSRSFAPRIALLRSMMSGEIFLQFGPEWENHPTGPLQPNKRTTARIRGTQLLEERVQWVLCVELHFFLLGWSMGEKWCSSTAKACNEQQHDIPRA
jgi:hypothetical protein